MSDATRGFAATALSALIAAAALHLAVMAGAAWLWPAYVELMIFGWITGMILAVSYHTIPVFSGRSFPSPRVGRIHAALFAIGLCVTAAGSITDRPQVTAAGLWLQTLAALIYLANLGRLFTHSPRGSKPPVPSQDQYRLDRIGIVATSAAGLCLPLACGLLAAAGSGWIAPEWRLAAEHLALLGWVMGTIVGVALHVLPRFTGRSLRRPAWAGLQLVAQGLAVTWIVLGLGAGWPRIFTVGAASMAVAVGLFAWTVWPALAGRASDNRLRIMPSGPPR